MGTSTAGPSIVVPSRCAAIDAVGHATAELSNTWCTECSADSTPNTVRTTARAATTSRGARRGTRAADPTMTITRIGQDIADDAWEPAACDAMDVSDPGEVVWGA